MARASSDLGADFALLARRGGGGLFFSVAAATALFVIALFALRADKIFGLPPDLAAMSSEDLPAYQRAAELALAGQAAAAFDPEVFRAGLPPIGQGLLFLNPPHFLPLVAPLGLLPYGAAKAIWIVLSAAALLGAARLIGADRLGFGLAAALLALSPAAFAAALVWQLSFFAAAALAGGLLLARDRPWVAGALLAFATVKPQFGLIAPIILLGQGDWRAIRAAALCTLGLVLGSVVVLGWEPWRAFFHSLSGPHAAHAAALMRDAVTIHQTAGKLGAGHEARAALQIVGIAAYAFAAWRMARGAPRMAAAGFALIASFAAAPSAWLYDWMIVAVGVMLLFAGQPRPLHLQLAAAAVWAAPLIPLGLGTQTSSVFPPLLLHLFALTVFLSATATSNATAAHRGRDALLLRRSR